MIVKQEPAYKKWYCKETRKSLYHPMRPKLGVRPTENYNLNSLLLSLRLNLDLKYVYLKVKTLLL